MEEREIKIALVPKEWISEDRNMYRISCDGMNHGWGYTLEEAILNFDKENLDNQKIDLKRRWE